MKLKYLHQQMLSHISVILIAFVILSLVVSNFAENLVFKNKEDELLSYGEHILSDLNLSLLTNTITLNRYADILEKGIFIFPFLMRKVISNILLKTDFYNCPLPGKNGKKYRKGKKLLFM